MPEEFITLMTLLFLDDWEDEGIHMVDEHHTRNHQNLHEEDSMMYDAPVGDHHGAGSGASSADTATITNVPQDMQVQQDNCYADECQRRVSFEAAQIDQYNLMQKHLSIQDSNF